MKSTILPVATRERPSHPGQGERNGDYNLRRKPTSCSLYVLEFQLHTPLPAGTPELVPNGLFTLSLRVEPERVQLLSNESARIRISGRGFGWLCIGKRRRFVFGSFYDTEVVGIASGPELPVRLIGPAAPESRRVLVQAAYRLHLPQSPIAPAVPALKLRPPTIRPSGAPTLNRRAFEERLKIADMSERNAQRPRKPHHD